MRTRSELVDGIEILNNEIEAHDSPGARLSRRTTLQAHDSPGARLSGRMTPQAHDSPGAGACDEEHRCDKVDPG
eukprot:gene10007-biopygen9240